MLYIKKQKKEFAVKSQMLGTKKSLNRKYQLMDGTKQTKVEKQMQMCQMGFYVVTSVAEINNDVLSLESTAIL